MIEKLPVIYESPKHNNQRVYGQHVPEKKASVKFDDVELGHTTRRSSKMNPNFKMLATRVVHRQTFQSLARRKFQAGLAGGAQLKKTFIRKIKLLILMLRWFKSAYDANMTVRDKYLSFSQLFDFESNCMSKLDNHENLTIADDARLRSEMIHFNKNYFKPHLSYEKLILKQETKNILAKIPIERTDREICALVNSFRHLKSISSLSNDMQEQIFKCCWLETYEPKRVIIRQTHRAEHFYFIISGSLVVTERSADSHVSYTICFLEPGTTFGELALLSRSLRTSTVISRQCVELLVISKEDFFNIFMGKRPMAYQTSASAICSEIILNHIDFLANLKFLKGWPIDVLLDNPNSILFCYFRRKQILLRHSNFSKYIYVVKKGSLSVWIKVKKKLVASKNPHSRNPVVKLCKKTSQLSDDSDDPYFNGSKQTHFDNINYFESDKFLEEQHNEVIGEMETNERAKLKRAKTLSMVIARMNMDSFLDYIKLIKDSNKADDDNDDDLHRRKSSKFLPPINIPKRKVTYATRKKFDNNSSLHTTNTVRCSNKNAAQSGFLSFSQGVFHLPNLLRMKPHKSTWMRAINGGQNSEKKSNNSCYLQEPVGIEPNKKFKTTIELIENNDANFRRLSISDNFGDSAQENNPITTEFLEIQTLTAGSYFGLQEILFENQPDMYLISNECDCILLSKDIFMQHASTIYLRDLRKSEIAFPTLSEIMRNYETYLKWNNRKQADFFRKKRRQ